VPAKKGGAHVGLTSKGKGTKWMLVIDGKGLPLGFHLDSVTRAEVQLAQQTLDTIKVARPHGRPKQRPAKLVADRRYDTDAFRRVLRGRGIRMCIPPKRRPKNWKPRRGRLERMTAKRTRRIDHYLHTASRRIIDLLVAEGIGTLCIGQNPLWKQQVNLGRRNNQNFVSIPHARFIEMLTYKAALVGIQVKITEESYTSKASFLDEDPLPVFDPAQPTPTFSGKRVKRGLYRAADGRHINADVNGAYNIMRKVAPEAFTQGSRGCVVHPMRLVA
jgi:IS605 OrfB family transposase